MESSKNLILRKSGNIVELSDGSTLHKSVGAVVKPLLSYTYKRFLRGLERKLAGDKPVEFIPRHLYRLDCDGRLCFASGFAPRIVNHLRKIGYSVEEIDLDPPHHRPDRFREDWDALLNTVYFKPKQADAIVAIAGNDRGIIDMPTGAGKGMLLVMVCLLYPDATIHIVVPGKDLVRKTVKLLSSYLPLVGQVGAGKKRFERVTVFSADSLHLSSGDADIMMFDEVHCAASPSYGEPLSRYTRSRNFGLTASVGVRADGADFELEAFFGTTIYKVTYQEAVHVDLVAPIEVDWVPVHLDNNPCQDMGDVARKKWGVWCNNERNKLIASKAASFSPDEQVLVMVETIEHLMNLRKLLPDFSVCYAGANMSEQDLYHYRRIGLMGQDELPLTDKQRQQLRLDFESGKVKKAIANTVWDTGVDFVNLSVLVRAEALDSRTKDIQTPGRVSRTNTGKSVGLVIDFIDYFDKRLYERSLDRRNSYRSRGWNDNWPETKGSGRDLCLS